MPVDVRPLRELPADAPGAGWARACALDAGHVTHVLVQDGDRAGGVEAVAWRGSPWGSGDGADWSLAGRADAVRSLYSRVLTDEGVGPPRAGDAGAGAPAGDSSPGHAAPGLVVPVEVAGALLPEVTERFVVRTLDAAGLAGAGRPSGGDPGDGRPAPPGAARWLPRTDRRVESLVERAFPDTEVRPGDPRADAWLGWEDGGMLLAVCCRLRTDPGLALLSSLSLEPGARGRGLATALTRAFAGQVLAGGAELVALGHYTSNTAASRVYDAVGMGRVELGWTPLARAGTTA